MSQKMTYPAFLLLRQNLINAFIIIVKMQTAGFSQNVLLNNEYPFCKMSYDVEQVITFQHVINMKRKTGGNDGNTERCGKRDRADCQYGVPGIE